MIIIKILTIKTNNKITKTYLGGGQEVISKAIKRAVFSSKQEKEGFISEAIQKLETLQKENSDLLKAMEGYQVTSLKEKKSVHERFEKCLQNFMVQSLREIGAFVIAFSVITIFASGNSSFIFSK